MDDAIREALDFEDGVRSKTKKEKAAPVWVSALAGALGAAAMFMLACPMGAWVNLLVAGLCVAGMLVVAVIVSRRTKVRPALRQDPFAETKRDGKWWATLLMMLWPLIAMTARDFVEPMPVWLAAVISLAAGANFYWAVRTVGNGALA